MTFFLSNTHQMPSTFSTLKLGPRTRDCQVATFGDNHTQTLSSVSCQVGGLDWNMSHDATNATGRFVPIDDVVKSVRTDFIIFAQVWKDFYRVIEHVLLIIRPSLSNVDSSDGSSKGARSVKRPDSRDVRRRWPAIRSTRSTNRTWPSNRSSR